VNAGATSITLGAVTYGTTPISSGDVLLIMQMQGAQINSSNNSNYGDGTGNGYGYLNNGNLLAGNMEYVVATNNVPLSGGTLSISSGLTKAYKNAAFSTDGQYTYQVIRVPLFYSIKLIGAITAPRWNGASGGVIVISATDSIIMNGQTIDASGLGFRGGGGISYNGSGSGSSSDYRTVASANANGGKGEGIAGTPKYLNNNNAFLDVSTLEGYPNGSYGRGAPGNAGGGGTDGNPVNNNNENTGGGGGGNGGLGGNGGNAWSSGKTSGGKPGAIFAQSSTTRLVMGGGGGSGTTNNGTGTPGSGFASSGAAGGGIIILMANVISGTGSVFANGSGGNNTVQNDGSGGGGAGGSILIFSKTGTLTSIKAIAKGGAGGSNQNSTVDSHGPGGGGGGGIIYASSALSATSNVNGGNAGTTDKGTNNYGATAGSIGTMSTSMTQSQMSTFPITCVVLASEFISINASQSNGTSNVKWEISGEYDIRQYEVERSYDGVGFSYAGTVAYKYTAAATNQYQFADNIGNYSGTVYYRVKQVEISSATHYSKIVSVNVSADNHLNIWPNPVRSSATVSFTMTMSGSVTLRLFDTKGSLVRQQQYAASVGSNIIQLDNPGTLPNGIYILQWSDGLHPQQEKMVVNR
jgi:hypothetical protein